MAVERDRCGMAAGVVAGDGIRWCPLPPGHDGRCVMYAPVEPADGAIIPALRCLLDAPDPDGGLTLKLLDAALADVPLNARRPPTEVALDRYRRARANTARELDIYGTAEERRWVLWALDGLINGRTANADEGRRLAQRHLEINAVVRARELGLEPKTCSCCGDHHLDVGLVNGALLCFHCQPCPTCGIAGGDCDPYGGPAGNSNTCVNQQ